jgi:predicted amidophosphoribosyltransferase
VLEHADAVIPVPLHPLRRWKRGFNQASLVAQHLGRPLWPVLMRRRHTPPQASLRADDRRRNVSNAFAVRRAWRAREPLIGWPRSFGAPMVTPQALRGRYLVVVDDVCTTGSTMASCMALLADCGARVVGLTVALVANERLVPRPETLLPHRAGHRR